MATDVVLPMLGITAEHGKIIEWLKQEGDAVEKGEVLFVVEVEKAVTEVESPATGILARIIVPVDVEIPVKTRVAIITEPGEAIPDDESISAPEKDLAAPAAEPESVVEMAASAASERKIRAGRIKAIPAARLKAAESGLDLRTIPATGPDNVILLKDVESALTETSQTRAVRASALARRLAEKESQPLEKIGGTGVRGRIMRADVQHYLAETAAKGPGLGEVLPMSSVRKVIARRMSESAFTAPHIYFFTDVCFDPLLEFRKEILPDFEKHYVLRPSINDFLIKAVALNIRDFPMLNAQARGDEIHIMPEIYVGLAVAVSEGLVVPALSRADESALVDIVRERIDLVSRARDGKLTLEEMERGTFTISSLAQYDITHFTAILNPPQSGILSVGNTDEKLALKDGQVVVKHIARLGLSVDHRIIDGAVAAEFLQNLKWKLERPYFMFLDL